MAKVKCVVAYNDLQLKRLVEVGEELDLADDRAEALIKKGLVEATEVVVEEKKPVVKKANKKR